MPVRIILLNKIFDSRLFCGLRVPDVKKHKLEEEKGNKENLERKMEEERRREEQKKKEQQEKEEDDGHGWSEERKAPGEV